ncbi:MAG: ompA 3 [Burkholderiaceae bacterium]|nr:ompA 3 [Burkholderiaceae bacterium]
MKKNFYHRFTKLLFLQVVFFSSFNAYAQSAGVPLSAAKNASVNKEALPVVIYREYGESKNAVTAYINGHVTGVLLPGAYTQVGVCQGTFNLSIQEQKTETKKVETQKFATKQSETTYIKVSGDGIAFREVLPTEALQDLKSIKVTSNVINRFSAICKSSERIVNLGADALFASNGSDISPTGVAQLNSLIADLKTQMNEVSGLKIIGHTDSLGDERYNEALSLARASSVARYLGKQGLSLPMETEGRGEREPVSVGCDQFKAERSNMIACLQPDRRVVIELLDKQQ